MTQYTADALSAPHSQREMDMIEDDNAQKMHITVPPIMCSFEDTTHAYECGYRDGRRAAQPTAEVERLLRQRDQAEARYTKACGMLDRTHVRAEKAEAALAAMTAERDAAFAAGIEAAAVILNDDATTLDADAARFRGGSNPHHERADKANLLRAYRDALRALAATDQRAAFDKLVAERVAAELAKRGEPVAWQHLKDGKWVECSEFVAKGWGDSYGPNVRPLYAHPAPTSAVTVKPQACATDGCDRLSEVYFVRADVGSHYCGQCYLKVHGMEQSRLAALSPAEQEGGA